MLQMSKTTTVRLSKKTKTRLEKVAMLTGWNLSRTLDFAIETAEEKVDKYHGNINSLLKLKQEKSGYKDTSENVDKVLSEEESIER
jgi:predicted DNA-binding protein